MPKTKTPRDREVPRLVCDRKQLSNFNYFKPDEVNRYVSLCLAEHY